MSSSENRFTDKQGQYLAFIDAYTRVNGRAPRPRQTCSATSASARRRWHQMVLSLEHTGLIRRQPGHARSIQVLVNPEHLPVLLPAQQVKSSVLRN